MVCGLLINSLPCESSCVNNEQLNTHRYFNKGFTLLYLHLVLWHVPRIDLIPHFHLEQICIPAMHHVKARGGF